MHLILTLNDKLALIDYYLDHHYLTDDPVGLKLCRTTSGDPRIIFGKVGQSSFLCDTTLPYVININQLMII